MKYDVLHNFISPVTGRIIVNTDYTLVGDASGYSVPSPILIDIQLDIIEIRTNYNTLVQATFVIGEPNNQLPYAQVLNTMGNGYIYSTDGVIRTDDVIPLDHLTNLQETYVWVGGTQEIKNEEGEVIATVPNRPIPVQNIELINLPNLAQDNLWIGDSNDRPAPQLTIQIQNLPDLSIADTTDLLVTPESCFWLSNDTRPQVMPFVPAVAEAIAEIAAEAAGGGAFYVINASLTELHRQVNFMSIGLTGLAVNSGGTELDVQILNNAVEELAIDVAKLYETTGELRSEVDTISDTVAGLNSSITELDYIVTDLFSNVIQLNSDIILISNTINNLRLNNISADADVSLYNYRITNLGDPIDNQDGVTKGFLQNYVQEYVGDNDTGFKNPAVEDLDMNNYRIKNLKQSPEGDFDAPSTKFIWDLLNDDVEIIWQ